MVATCSLRGIAALVVLSSLAACGGGGGGGGSSNPPTPTFTVGGTVTGLTGTGLTLRNNGGNTLTVAGNGAFTFSTAIASGTSYSITVATQPGSPTQVCTVANGSGTISANVTNVAVTCVTNTHTVGGTVTGLSGSGLVLQNNGGNNLAIANNGPFTFTTPISEGSAYAVTVSTGPINPSQTCVVANGSGTITANVTNVTVTCVTNARTIGGTVSGLSGSGLVLQKNAGDNLAITGNGAFTFATPISEGAAYAVTALTQPTNPSQTCAITNGSGIAGNSDVTSVAVACTTNSFTVSATVTGLTGDGLVLGNGANQVTFNADGTLAFATAVTSGADYNVVIDTAPSNPVQRCSVTNGSGTMTNASISVNVTCVASFPTFAYGINSIDGTVSSYAIDATTGQLRSRFNAKTGDAPLSAITYKTGIGDQFSYVVNQDSDDISAFAADPRSGALDEVALSPFATGGVKPKSLVLHPTLPFLYAPNESSANIAAFTINETTGELTQVGPVATGTTPSSFVIEASGRFAYAAAPGSSELYTYAINQSTGALTEVPSSRVAIGTSIGGIALERSGKFLYLFNKTPGTISAFAINAASGVLTPVAGSPFTAGANAAFAAMHPNGKFIYVKHSVPTQTTADGLSVFAINSTTGALSEIAGSPFDTSANPVALSFDPTGRYLYAAHVRVVPTEFNVRAYAVDAATGALAVVAGSPFATVSFPSSLDVDASGKYLYVTTDLSNQLTSYSINAGTGALVQLAGSPANVGVSPTFVDTAEDTTALQLLSKFVYTVNDASNSISVFDIDTAGQLTVAAQPTTATGASPSGLTLDPKGRYAYVANTDDDTISIYNVDPQEGELTPISGSPVAAGLVPSYIVIEPSGRYAYVTAGGTNSILQFTIDQSTGLLSSPVTTAVGQSVHVMAMSPNGRALHVATTSDALLRTYPIDPSTGALGAATNVNTGGAVTAMAVDPSGKVLYATDAAAGVLRMYSISSVNNTLSPLATYTHAAGSTPSGVAFDPAGRFAFIADGAHDMVDMFTVQPNSAASYLTSYPAGDNPLSVTTDYSGDFVVVATGTGDLMTFEIDRNAATLTPVDAESGLPGVQAAGTVTTSSHAQ